MIKAIVTDIEGTTTQLSFVKDVLFPFAYTHLPTYVEQHKSSPAVAAILDETRKLLDNEALSDQQIIQQFLQWIEQDKKITPLKTLQGLIWQNGYQQGQLKSHVYADAVEQLQAWHQQGLILAIFSSGSILAQKLLFAHTEYGDLTPLFSAYFDTTTGAKNAALSYEHIAQQLNFPPQDILFLSDVEAELDAAAAAGMHTCGLVRDAAVISAKHLTAKNFYEINQ